MSRLRWAREQALDYQQAMAGHITSMSSYASASDWGNAFIQCSYALEDCRWALSYLYHVKTSDPLEFGDTFFLENYTIEAADEYELTWEKIIAAWDGATFEGWGRTILAIDQMRQEIFNYPLTRFGPLPIFQ